MSVRHILGVLVLVSPMLLLLWLMIDEVGWSVTLPALAIVGVILSTTVLWIWEL